MVSNEILAEGRHENTRFPSLVAKFAAIKQRTTRGLLVFNAGGVHHLEDNLWAVQSSRASLGFHKVDLDDESCSCEDWMFHGRELGIGCRHIYAAAIANSTRRSGIREVRTIKAVAGDPFRAAGKAKKRNCYCFGGYVTIGVEEDGTIIDEAVPCRRCERS